MATSSSSSNGGSSVLLTLLILAFLIFRGAFVGDDVARRAPAVYGFSDIQIVGSAWFFVGVRGCDVSDAVRFDVRATNPIGKVVTFSVCTGAITKDATIRTY